MWKAPHLWEYLNELQQRTWLVQETGKTGHAVFAGLATVFVLCGFPRLLFCVIGGAAFGWKLGLLYSATATLLAYYLQFIFVRWGGRPYVEKYLLKYPRASKIIRTQGLGAVILARQVPLPGLVINFAFGLSTVRKRDYVFGTLIGQLPEAVPCAMAGAGLMQSANAKELGLMLIAAICTFTVLYIGFKLLLKKLNSKKDYGKD